MGVWLRNRWWWIVVILALSLVGWEEERCQTQAYQCRAEYAPQLASVPADQKAAEQEAIAAACEPSGYFCRLFGATNIATVLLVLVGIGGIWAAIKTLKSIQKQTDIFDRQTKLSEENLRLLVSRERPRIRVLVPEDFTIKPGAFGIRAVSYKIHCRCPTPANIVESSAEVYFEGVLEKIPFVLNIPNLDIVEGSRILDRHAILFESDEQQVESKVKAGRLHFHGYIKYRGIHLSDSQPPYRTWFHYRWVPGSGALYGSLDRWEECEHPKDDQEQN